MAEDQIREIEADLQRRLHPRGRNQRQPGGYMDTIPTVKCADGFKMSVQTGPSHYCTPRDGYGPWVEVEVGFPSAKVEAFMPYIDGEDSDPTDTVYGYVPLSIVAQTIIDHGGLRT